MGYTEYRCNECGNYYKDDFTDKLKISVPTEFNISKLDGNRVKISWQRDEKLKDEDAYAEYSVFYKAQNEDEYRSFVSTKEEAVLEELKKDTEYTAYLEISVNSSPYITETRKSVYEKSNTFTFKTGYNVLPESLKISNSKENEILLKWEKAVGASGYTVFREENGEFKKLADTVENFYTDTTFIPSEGTCKYAVKAYYKQNKYVLKSIKKSGNTIYFDLNRIEKTQESKDFAVAELMR